MNKGDVVLLNSIGFGSGCFKHSAELCGHLYVVEWPGVDYVLLRPLFVDISHVVRRGVLSIFVHSAKITLVTPPPESDHVLPS